MKANLTRAYMAKWVVKYFSLKILLLGLSICTLSCQAQKTDFSNSLFDGTTLNGWKTVKEENAKFWSVKDSVITGGDGVTKIPTNTYLYTTNSFGDFEFRALFRLTGDHSTGLINSGIQYRSIIKDNKISATRRT